MLYGLNVSGGCLEVQVAHVILMYPKGNLWCSVGEIAPGDG